MADWYVSSTAYNAIAAFQPNTAYTVGQIIRWAGTPNNLANWTAHRCTTAGTTGATEPVWAWNSGGTTASGGATFTNITGDAAYGWTAAAGNLWTFGDTYFTRVNSGDRVFVSSDHTETAPGGFTIGINNYSAIMYFSVNRAGSVPPVPADLLPGATVTFSGTAYWEGRTNQHFEGFTFYVNTSCNFNNGAIKQFYFKNCTFICHTNFGRFSANNPSKLIWDNCKIQFTGISQGFGTGYAFDFTWINSPNATAGSTAQPSNMFLSANNSRFAATCRGVDFSAFTGGFASASASSGGHYVLLDSCKISPAAIRLANPSNSTCGHDDVELINCDVSGTPSHERHNTYGTMTTDRSTVMTGGGVDLGGSYSLKLASYALGTSNFSPTASIETLFFDVENTVVGTPRTATIQIISSATLNTGDIRLTLAYPNVAGSTLTSTISTRPTDLTAVASLPTSSATWSNMPTTPIKQYLQVSFTAAAAGRVRGRVYLMKQNSIVWVNPQIVLA